MRISLCLCAVLAVQGICLAQKSRAAKTKKQKPQTANIVAEIVRGNKRQVGQAHIKHMAELDRTWAEVDLSEVYRLQNLPLTMRATIDVPGNKVSQPEHVTFRIFYPEGDPAFAEPPALSIETDAGWLDFGAMRRDHQERFGLTGPIFKAAAKEIEFESFERIANSQRINMRVGKIEFQLNKKQVQGLRDLLGTVGQQL